MFALKYFLEVTGLALISSAVGLAGLDLYRQKALVRGAQAARLLGVGLVLLLAGLSFQLVSAGMAGVRVSQLSGTMPGTLYPGTHVILPLIQSVDLYSIRDTVYQTTVAADPKRPSETLRAQTREGLVVGLAVAVRYRLDPQKLSHIHSNLPQPVETELVPPVVASVFREIAPNYMTRELFASKRRRCAWPRQARLPKSSPRTA